MGLVDAVKRALARPATSGVSPKVRSAAAKEDTGEDLRVPEVTSAQLMAEMGSDVDGPVLLDIRENYERAQGFIPGSLHVPMNSIPHRLEELDPNRELVVYCAHGNRSYGVTGWLLQQGYKARSLKGGIVAWQHQNGAVEPGYRGRS